MFTLAGPPRPSAGLSSAGVQRAAPRANGIVLFAPDMPVRDVRGAAGAGRSPRGRRAYRERRLHGPRRSRAGARRCSRACGRLRKSSWPSRSTPRRDTRVRHARGAGGHGGDSRAPRKRRRARARPAATATPGNRAGDPGDAAPAGSALRPNARYGGRYDDRAAQQGRRRVAAQIARDTGLSCSTAGRCR